MRGGACAAPQLSFVHSYRQVTLRPYGIVVDGRLEHGLEVELTDDQTIESVRPLVGEPEEYVLSAAFVNAHSHLEYRGLQGKVSTQSYPAFIKEITLAKREQSKEQVREDCLVAAYENGQTGVAYIAEHSDRPFSGDAMKGHGLDGIIFQEVITFNESSAPADRLALVAEAMRLNTRVFTGEVHINPHAPWTVDEDTLRSIGTAGGRVSIHVAESVFENDYLESDAGPLAEASRSAGMARTHGMRSVAYLGWCGYLRPGVQFVHCCDVTAEEVASISASGVAVAHCPRSNEALDCPRSPVREFLDAGTLVGLGMDSAASSGPIDMFAEMRAAIEVARKRGAEVTPEEVWRMATTMGAESLGLSSWDVVEGSTTPLVKLHVPFAESVRDLIEACSPRSVEWVVPTVHN